MLVEILPSNNTYCRIEAERSVLLELNDHFSYKIPGADYMPLKKAGLWDGKKKLLSLRTNEIYKGLRIDIYRFCDSQGYEVRDKCGPNTPKVKIFFDDFRKTINLTNEIRDFQKTAICEVIENDYRVLIESATGSGKSLIIYLLARYVLAAAICKKMLIIVPTVMLVDQIEENFNEYGENDLTWNPKSVHKIYSGTEKTTERPITISTWQSVYKQPPEFFAPYDGIICDEVHTATAESITAILEKSVNAHLRVGLTGTFDDNRVHRMVLKGLFGPIVKISSTADLMEKNILAQLTVKCLILRHKEEISKPVRKMSYQEELDFTVTYPKRNNYITSLATKLKGNTLILVNRIEHGEILKENISKSTANVHFISGSMKPEERNEIKKACEGADGMIIIATYGVFQMGINIVNLDNIIFGSPSKSKIQVLQSIGRCLRRSSDKISATVYDLVDNYQGKFKKENYLWKHFIERLGFYTEQKFDVKHYELEF